MPAFEAGAFNHSAISPRPNGLSCHFIRYKRELARPARSLRWNLKVFNYGSPGIYGNSANLCILARISAEPMLKNIPVIISFFILAAFAASAQSSAGLPPLAITGVNVIDATGSPVQTEMTVIIQDDRIVNIGKTARVKRPKNAKVVDARGKFLIPGLWDMHVHTIFGDWIPGGKEVSLPLFVANGVTGVRDMGGDLDTLLQWRAHNSCGGILGPRLIISRPLLDGPKTHFPHSFYVTTAHK